jgi:hypothetical protein
MNIQLREKIISGTTIERSFAERVLPQSFGNGIKTDGDGDRADGILVYHENIGRLGGYAKTKIGMVRLINKMKKELV